MAEYEGMDALMAAITDEPLPEGARDDAEFLAEHRSALADIALLREQLRLMGDTLAAETPAADDNGRRRPRPPHRRPRKAREPGLGTESRKPDRSGRRNR